MTTSPSAQRTLRASGWLAALLAAIALVATGCGPPKDPVERLQAAQQTMLDAGSAAFTIEQSFEGGPISGEKIVIEGVLAFADRIGRATLKMADGEAEAVFAGDATYFRIPSGPQPTPWIRLDPQDIEKFSGLGGISDDPSRNLDLLDGIAGDVERVGEEDVRGARTTHYRLTVDLQQAVAKAPADRREAVQQQAALLGGGQLPMEIWLDNEGRIARQAFALDLSKIQLPTGGRLPDDLNVTSRTRIEYYDFGTKVDVKPPPDDQVTDFGKLQGN